MQIPAILIAPEELFEVFGFPVTNSFLLTLVLSICLIVLFFFAFRKRKIVPDSFQNFFEWALESLLSYVDGITGDREKTLKIFPLSAIVFIFILLANLLEIFPGLGIFKFLRSPSSDLNFTLTLAIFSMVFVHILAIKDLGFSTYIKKYINLKNPILFFVGFLEGLAEITRTFSLAIRLFGNLLAGEILLMVVSFMIAYLFPLPFLGLEIFVGFIQALIFSSLIVIFYVVTSEKPEE